MFLTIISGTNAAWYEKDLVQPDLADVRITTRNTQTAVIERTIPALDGTMFTPSSPPDL